MKPNTNNFCRATTDEFKENPLGVYQLHLNPKLPEVTPLHSSPLFFDLKFSHMNPPKRSIYDYIIIKIKIFFTPKH